MDDKLAQLARQVEQGEAEAEAMGNITAIYFSRLLEKKLTRQEALYLTGIWIKEVWGTNKESNGQ